MVDEDAMSNELIISEPQRFMPALSIGEAVQRRVALVEFVQRVMKSGVDFGVIPGTQKPTLLKPGAEKLCTLFGLTSRFQLLRAVEDWKGETSEGEPFFYYLYHCQLWRDALLIAEGDGSCNSWEQKYRYRDAQRVCPACGVTAIIKGKAEYGGGWLCFVKKGGCGAKFGDEDETITGQPIGRVRNPDIADVVNTIQKMAQKRALIAATLLAVNASEFFTQDEEERVIDAVVVSPIGETAVEPPILTAQQAREAFEVRAREQYGMTDRPTLARLAVLLLNRRPPKWTAQVWLEAAGKPEAIWESAVRALGETPLAEAA
jgi:hypothetical protein